MKMLRHKTVRWAAAHAAAGMVAAASASASPTWLSTVPLPLDSGHSAHGVQVGMDARGDALTLFNITQTGVTNAQTVETDDRFAGRVFGNFTDMSSGPIEADTVGSFDGRLAVDGAGDAAATWTYQSDPGTNPDAHTIRLRRRPAGGDWGSPVDASAPGAPAGEDARFPSIAVDGHGTPTVAWQDTSSGGPVRAVTEPAIGGPRMPQLLTGTGEAGSDPSVAANARGDRAVAWRLLNGTGDQAIALNTAAPGTAAFGAHKTLANSSGTNVVTPPAAALTATGTATVVWAEGATTGAISAADVPLGGKSITDEHRFGNGPGADDEATRVRDERPGRCSRDLGNLKRNSGRAQAGGAVLGPAADRVARAREFHARRDQRSDGSLRRRAGGLERRHPGQHRARREPSGRRELEPRRGVQRRD